MGLAHEPAALAGGYVFVLSGLFLAAQDEAEFAGMLAHAMQHVAQRRGVGRVTPALFAAFGRSAELDADVAAVQTLARAGFDPKALVRSLHEFR